MASLIDLHTHTSYSSACGQMTAEELIESAIKAGLDGVAVTEHLVIEGAQVAQEIARCKYGFPLFCGVEANATIFGDVLVFGCARNFEPQIPWTALRRLVTDVGGVLIPAHPFRRRARLTLWNYLQKHGLPLDGQLVTMHFVQGLTAIEVCNGGNQPEENQEAAKLAHCLGLPGIGGSDAHSPEKVGQAATWFPGDITTDVELTTALKQGGYYAVDRRERKKR
jgi:predicted metal-dependent phosphoesterase TrpH